jgi:predicted nucleic acid-binding protein
MRGKRKPWAYFDTSVLVKRYIHEKGSDEARSLLTKYRFVSSRVALVEAASTFKRRHDSRDLDARQFAAILARFDADRAHFELIEPTREVLDRAEMLVRKNNIRSLDAIHIASSVCFNDAINGHTPFITADVHQRRSAAGASLDVIWVES